MRRRPEPGPNPALIAMMQAEISEKPWQGSISLDSPKPPEPPPIQLEIPPPPSAVKADEEEP